MNNRNLNVVYVNLIDLPKGHKSRKNPQVGIQFAIEQETAPVNPVAAAFQGWNNTRTLTHYTNMSLVQFNEVFRHKFNLEAVTVDQYKENEFVRILDLRNAPADQQVMASTLLGFDVEIEVTESLTPNPYRTTDNPVWNPSNKQNADASVTDPETGEEIYTDTFYRHTDLVEKGNAVNQDIRTYLLANANGQPVRELDRNTASQVAREAAATVPGIGVAVNADTDLPS